MLAMPATAAAPLRSSISTAGDSLAKQSQSSPPPGSSVGQATIQSLPGVKGTSLLSGWVCQNMTVLLIRSPLATQVQIRVPFSEMSRSEGLRNRQAASSPPKGTGTPG